jgi:transcriptional regulator with XRE-family HTH domain
MQDGKDAQALRVLRKLGSDLSRARRRRRMTQVSLAQRACASLSTIRRLERGEPQVPLVFLARVLSVFGELDALGRLMDAPQDEIGLLLADEQLPKRVRAKKQASTGAL